MAAQEELALPITFEISPAGIPIVLGREVAVGRRVSLGNAQYVLYTRVEPLPNGIVIHSNFEDERGVVTGSSVATFVNEGENGIRYRITSTITEGVTLLVNDCDTLLMPQ